jgi:hypothetical protein
MRDGHRFPERGHAPLTNPARIPTPVAAHAGAARIRKKWAQDWSDCGNAGKMISIETTISLRRGQPQGTNAMKGNMLVATAVLVAAISSPALARPAAPWALAQDHAPRHRHSSNPATADHRYMVLMYIRRQYRDNVLVQMTITLATSGPHANIDLAVHFKDIPSFTKALFVFG